MASCDHCGCTPAAEVLRRDVNVGQGGAWLVRYRDKHFVVSTGREGDTLVFRASPTGEVTDWDNVASPVYGTDKQQALDALTARPVDETGRVLSPRDEMDDAEAADDKRRAQTSSRLNEIMDFDHPVLIGPDGSVHDGLEGVYAPDLVMETDDDGQILDQHERDYITAARNQGWELLSGWTGQHLYRGPVMHASEFVGGALADHISETPGTYVVFTVECDQDSGPAGWAVARKIETEQS